MKTMKLKLFAVALCGVFLIPQLSHAGVTAVAMTDNTGLFIINFDFIAGKEDFRIPIGVLHGLDFGSTSTFAGYKVFSGDREVTDISKTAGIVLSKQPVVDGMYYEIKAGERAQFSLVSLVTIPESNTLTHYHTELSHSPYRVGDTWTEVAENRLGKFRSDSVLLNKNIQGGTYTLKVETK
jgi:hypothetical protein